MFKKSLKKNVIPITIVALALVVGIGLFFNVSSVYKKTTIINTNKAQKADKTYTSDGTGCVNRFNLLGISVIQNDDLDGDGYFTFTISSESTAQHFKQLVKESGYTNDTVSYKYTVQRVSDGKNLESGTISVDKTKYTSRKQTGKFSTKYKYKVYIASTNWIRDKSCTLGQGNYTSNSSPDEGYCTCNAGKVYTTYEFKAEKMYVEGQILSEDETFFKISGGGSSGSESNLIPSDQGLDDHVNNYSVNDSCKLPNNSQANEYLLPKTNMYGATKNVSATFRQYLTEYDNAPNAKKDSRTLKEGETSVSGTISLVCDYKLDIEDVKAVANSDNVAYSGSKLSDYKYDVSNTHYYKGTKTEKYTVPPYEYHTADGYRVDNKDNYCTRTCTEIVKVEYGSPVYVSAGMCFQYRMKISSIVQCKYDKSHMTPPSLAGFQICQPLAYCVHSYGASVGSGSNTQAGPNEDYEACVNKCDGGKYSSECSNACYNMVYGNQSYNDLALSYNSKPAKTGTTVGDYFTYFEYNNGNINFTSPFGWTYVGQAIGYSHETVTGLSMKGYVVKKLDQANSYAMDHGIPRAYYGGAFCGETCGWTKGPGCYGSATKWYFQGDTDNPNFGVNAGKYDLANNQKKYDDTLVDCSAKATCVTSTATYTMKVKYVDASGAKLKVETANYPWSKEATKVSSGQDGSHCALSMADKSPVISFGGCYVNNAADRWYQGEITFPGVYLDYKHNTIRIGGKAENNDVLLPGRMCIDGHQGNTNPVWAMKFDEAIGQLNKNSNYKINDVNNYWKDSFTGASGGFSAEKSDSVQGYNINGIINSFGYFKWNFNISCFYALYDPGNCEKDGDKVKVSCGSCDSCGDEQCLTADQAKGKTSCQKATCTACDRYTVRSFNASDPLVTKTTASRESEDIQYKENEIRGYNWTSAATLTKMKNGYQNDPELLAKNIEDNQNTIFDNTVNEPNYVIYLDKDTIKNIKNYNKNKSYSTFSDERPIDHNRVNAAGVYFYYSSDFLHNSSIFTSSYNNIPDIKSEIYTCNYYVNNKCILLMGGE